MLSTGSVNTIHGLADLHNQLNLWRTCLMAQNRSLCPVFVMFGEVSRISRGCISAGARTYSCAAGRDGQGLKAAIERGNCFVSVKPAVLRLRFCFAKLSKRGIDFSGEDEITFGQAMNLVRPDFHLHLAPSEVEVRVVALLFGDFPDSVDAGER